MAKTKLLLGTFLAKGTRSCISGCSSPKLRSTPGTRCSLHRQGMHFWFGEWAEAAGREEPSGHSICWKSGPWDIDRSPTVIVLPLWQRGWCRRQSLPQRQPKAAFWGCQLAWTSHRQSPAPSLSTQNHRTPPITPTVPPTSSWWKIWPDSPSARSPSMANATASKSCGSSHWSHSAAAARAVQIWKGPLWSATSPSLTADHLLPSSEYCHCAEYSPERPSRCGRWICAWAACPPAVWLTGMPGGGSALRTWACVEKFFLANPRIRQPRKGGGRDFCPLSPWPVFVPYLDRISSVPCGDAWPALPADAAIPHWGLRSCRLNRWKGIQRHRCPWCLPDCSATPRLFASS